MHVLLGAISTHINVAVGVYEMFARKRNFRVSRNYPSLSRVSAFSSKTYRSALMRLPERVPGADAYMTRTRSIGVRYVNTWDTCTGPIGPRPRTGTRIPRTYPTYPTKRPSRGFEPERARQCTSPSPLDHCGTSVVRVRRITRVYRSISCQSRSIRQDFTKVNVD